MQIWHKHGDRWILVSHQRACFSDVFTDSVFGCDGMPLLYLPPTSRDQTGTYWAQDFKRSARQGMLMKYVQYFLLFLIIQNNLEIDFILSNQHWM